MCDHEYELSEERSGERERARVNVRLGVLVVVLWGCMLWPRTTLTKSIISIGDGQASTIIGVGDGQASTIIM